MNRYILGDFLGRNVSARGRLECLCGEHITDIDWEGRVYGLELVCDHCKDALFPHNTLYVGSVELLDDDGEEPEPLAELNTPNLEDFI